MIIEWTPALRAEIDRAKAAASKVGSIYIFPTRSGQCYVDEDGRANGFDSLWQGFMTRVLITERDSRAKYASDADAPEHAQRPLAHASREITERVYRRKPDRVKPTK